MVKRTGGGIEMKAQEIEQAAKNVYPQCDGLRNIYNNADNDLKEEGFVKGANFVNIRQPYTAEDMQSIIKYIINALFDAKSSLTYSISRDKWMQYVDYKWKEVTITHILKLWEVSKNEKHT